MSETVYAVMAGVYFGMGAYLLMSRSLTRLVIGLIALSHGVNVALFLSGGLSGKRSPFVEKGVVAEAGQTHADPLPQALILTAIVISFALLAFAIVIYRRATENAGVEDISK